MSKVSNHSKTVEVDLEFPVALGKDGEEIIDKLVFHRPKGKHIKHFGKDPGIKDIFLLASKICEDSRISPSFFDEMDAKDCLRVSEVVGDFLDTGVETGKTQ